MRWTRSYRADKLVRELADRHYNRQSVGAAQFFPSGRCLVLVQPPQLAAWVTSWPLAEFTMHEWRGAWVNSLFRNEGREVASDLIVDAVAATRAEWPQVPALGMVSFVDPKHVQPMRRRLPPDLQRLHRFQLEGKPAVYGYAYLKAGFRHVGYTKGGLWVWQMLADEMPPACAAHGSQAALLA